MTTKITGTEMTSDEGKRQCAEEPAPVRANQAGSTCPPWCTANHAKVQTHMSDPATSHLPGQPQVRLVQPGSSRYPSQRPEVSVSKAAALLMLDYFDAKSLADLLEELADDCTPDQLRQLADDVRTAASVIDEAAALPSPAVMLSARLKQYNGRLRRPPGQQSTSQDHRL